MFAKLNKRDAAIYLAVLLISVYTAFQIPYTHDDWDWGLDVGLKHLLTADINSRYVGNFFEVIMTRSVPAKTIIIGTVFFAVSMMTTKLAVFLGSKSKGENNSCLFALSTALLLSQDKRVITATFNWVAGFANYTISLVFLGAFYWFIFNDEKDNSEKKNIVRYAAYGLITLAAQLFLENITVYIFMISLAALIIKRNKKYAFIFAGAAVGTVIMFSSPFYAELLENGNAVKDLRVLAVDRQTTLLSNIVSLLNNYLTNHFGVMYLCSSRICTLLAAALMIETILKAKELDGRVFKAFIAADCICIICYGVICGTSLSFIFETREGIMDIISGALFLSTVIVQLTVLFGKNVKTRNILLFLIISTQIVIAPLMVVRFGYSSSSYITSAFMLIIMVCIIADDILQIAGEKYCQIRYGKIFTAAVFALMLMILVQRAFVFGAIGIVDRQRREIINSCDFSVRKEIQLPCYPYSEHLWECDPDGEVRVRYFKEFYNIPEDADVVFVDETN